MVKQKKVIAYLREDKSGSLILDQKEANTIYQQGWYGQLIENTLYLDPYETIHLVERKKIVIKEEEKELKPKELGEIFSKNNKIFWRNYVVYTDLRNRGYVIRIGKEKEPFFFRLYPRGAIANKTPYETLIIPLQEGTGFPIKELDEVIKIATSTRKKLVFALVDSLGDISYVTVNELELEDNSKDKEFSKWKKGEQNETF